MHGAMRKAANVCGFSSPVEEAQSKPKLQQLVPKLKKRKQEEFKVRAKTKGTDLKAEVAQAKGRVQTAQRDVKDAERRIYKKVMAEHEPCMDRAVFVQVHAVYPEVSRGWKTAGDNRSSIGGWYNHRQQAGNTDGGSRKLSAATQPGAAGAQQDHTEDGADAATGAQGGTKRGHTPPQGDAGENDGHSAGP